MKKILLVEDNDLNRDMMRRRLERKGFMVTAVADGEACLAAVAQRTPDLILLDLGLPKITGWEVARQLKGAPQTQNLPIIALTAHAMPDEVEAALETGCDAFFAKPVIDFDTLVAKMLELLDNAAPMPQK